MVYRLSFFGRCDEEPAPDVICRLLDELTATGAPLLGEVRGPIVPTGEIAGYRPATMAPEKTATADWLHLEVHVGVAHNADIVIGADPDAEHGIWGSDLYAVITLSGGNPDWMLVDRIWSVLERLWSAVVGRAVRVRPHPSAFQPAHSLLRSRSMCRWVKENQLPESSRKMASTPYGRSVGSCRNSTPRAFIAS